MSKLLQILIAIILLFVIGLFLTGGQGGYVNGQTSCTDTYGYLRAQPDGQWILHEHPTTHPSNNVASVIQYTSKFKVVFTDPTNNVLWTNTQPSAVMGHNNYSLGVSGGLSSIDIWIGDESGNYVNPHTITNTNYGFWFSVRGCSN